MKETTEAKSIEAFCITKDGWTYVLVNGGQGGFLNPPGDLEHRLHIAMSRTGVIGSNSDTMSLRAVFADWASYIPQEVKDAVKKLLDENPGDVKDEVWIRSVYNYFQNGYTKNPAIRNVNDRENVYFTSRSQEPLFYITHAQENKEKHLGYLYIKQWDADHTPRMDLILRNWQETPAIDGEMWAQRPKKTEGNNESS